MKKILSIFTLSVLLLPTVGSAQVQAIPVTEQGLKAQIEALTIQLLLAQIESLKAQIAALLNAQGSRPAASATQESFLSTGVSEGAAQDEIDQKNLQCTNAEERLGAIRTSIEANDDKYTADHATLLRQVKTGIYGWGDGGLGRLGETYKAEQKRLANQETLAVKSVSALCN